MENTSVVADMEPLMTETQAAEFLGVARDTLTVWRCTGRVEIPYVKIGRAIRYIPKELRDHVKANTVYAR